MIHRAACSCEKLSLELEGEPVRVSMCHCLACQKRTGSPFGVVARFARDQIKRLEGEDRTWDRIGDDGGRATFHFCPTCAATVYYEATWMTDFVAVPVGMFADPTFPPPRVEVYLNRRHPWVAVKDIVVEHPYD